MIRIGIIAIQHESNTFLQGVTDLEFFKSCLFLRGNEVRERLTGAHHEVSGFLERLEEEAGFEAVPLFMAAATPGGIVTADALQQMWEIVLEEIDKAGPIDAWLVAPHGAGVSEEHRDMDGWWLSQLRSKVGDEALIVCTLDPHANVSERMILACDATITYRENPHLDQKARGREAATLIVRALRGEITLTQAAALPPVAINIERQLTSAYPALLLQQEAQRIRDLPGVLSVSVILGFPYADVAEMGSGFIVVTDGDADGAKAHAEHLEQWLQCQKEQFKGHLVEVEEAIAAIAESEKPVGLLDMGDNVGGGSPADSTLLAHALRESGVGKTLICLADPEAVTMATAAGVGKTLTLSMGGKTDAYHGEPFSAEVTVVSLHDGYFRETQPRHGGRVEFNMGPSVVVRTAEGMTVLLTTRRSAPVSIHQLLSCGIDPQDYDAIVIKGVHAPVAAYRDVCPTLIRVNTAGVTSADMQQFTYKHRRVPLFPFEEVGQ